MCKRALLRTDCLIELMNFKLRSNFSLNVFKFQLPSVCCNLGGEETRGDFCVALHGSG